MFENSKIPNFHTKIYKNTIWEFLYLKIIEKKPTFY